MPKEARIAVASPSFSKNNRLVSEIKQLFPLVKINESKKILKDKELVYFLEGHIAAVIGTEKIDSNCLSQLPNLKLISKYGVGMDNIDLQACERYSVAVGWTGGVNKRSVAEQALAFMICLRRNLYQSSLKLKAGTWEKKGGQQLSGSTVGIIGVGEIGKELIHLLRPFGCKLLAYDIEDRADYYNQHGVQGCTMEQIVKESDIITLHIPLTDLSRGLFNKAVFAKMKPSAYLINTSRGEVVVQDDLAEALSKHQIAGAALDVYEKEPVPISDFIRSERLFCTPHIGGNAEEAVLAMGRSAISHLRDYFNL